MSKKPLSKSYKDLLYLIRCAVRQEEVDATWSIQTPLATLFRLACFHSIEAFLYDTVKQMPLSDRDMPALKDWQMASDKAYRRYLLFTAERQAICSELEKAGIWYLPLKGVVLQEDYPKPYQRQMSDNDILFDITRRYDVKDIMLGRGYKVASFNYHFDDAYYKDPFYNFEMHVRAGVSPEFESYFDDLPQRLEKQSFYDRQMTNEDFYLYLLSHELKHFQQSGIGIRYLIDLQFYLIKHGQELDWKSIEKVLESVDVLKFEKQRRDLVAKLFESDLKIFREVFDDVILAYYCYSGIYGTFDQIVENRLLPNNGRRRHIGSYYVYKVGLIYKFVPDYPLLQKHRWLIPFYIFFRIFNGLFNPYNWKELLVVVKKLLRRQ